MFRYTDFNNDLPTKQVQALNKNINLILVSLTGLSHKIIHMNAIFAAFPILSLLLRSFSLSPIFFSIQIHDLFLNACI